jgi:hypothetical protein
MVACTHYGYDHLAALYPEPARVTGAIFYVLRGLEGAALFAVVGILSRSWWVVASCLWGAVEEGQTAVCRLAAGIDVKQSVPLFNGLCGQEAYWMGIAAAAVIAIAMLDKFTGGKT